MFRFLKNLLAKDSTTADRTNTDRDQDREPQSAAEERRDRPRLGIESLEERITPGGGWTGLG